MKRIRKSRAARVLSWLLTLSMITPLVRGIVAPLPALAQNVVPNVGALSTIMIDFVDKSGYPNKILVRFATDEVKTELSNSGRFDFVPTDEVRRTATELGRRPPYDQIALSQIASTLGATTVVTGEISYVKVYPKATPKTVRVGLRVRVQEASSGDLLNGAAQVGEARARPGVSDDDTLVQEAIRNAAVLSARQILQYTLAEGFVTHTVGTENVTVLINRGSRDGIQTGQEMIVLRGRQRVGKIVVTNVFPADSEARIVENFLGIRPEDKVRAIFPMPDFTRSGEIERPRRTSSGAMLSTLGKVLLVLVIGIAIYSAVTGKNTTVTGVVAESDIVNGAPAVRIQWRDNIFGQGNTLEYHIWRAPLFAFNPTGTPVAAVTGGQRTYTDFASPFSFWDGTRQFLQPAIGGGAGGGGQGGGAGNAGTVTPGAGEVPGFTPGQTVFYQVNSVIRRIVPQPATGGGGGGQQTTEDVYSDLVVSGAVTPIQQPLLGAVPADLANNVDIRQFNVTWLSRTGADVFQVEVSTDRTFKNRNLILQLPLIYSTAPLADGVPQTMQQPVDLTSSDVLRRDRTFDNFVRGVAGAPKPTLFWRVGARNSQDSPGPVHWISRQHNDNDKAFRFIYSQIRSFTPADLPPPRP